MNPTHTRHTPGPWSVMEPGTETAPNRAVVCAHRGQATIYDAPLTMETEANARLIAAAPELLEACKRVSSALFGVALGDLEFLRAAIAKAEGREA